MSKKTNRIVVTAAELAKMFRAEVKEEDWQDTEFRRLTGRDLPGDDTQKWHALAAEFRYPADRPMTYGAVALWAIGRLWEKESCATRRGRTMTARVASRLYCVSHAHLKRLISKGGLTDCRPPEHKSNAPLIVLEAELDARFERREQ